jgi:hypothetical protein
VALASSLAALAAVGACRFGRGKSYPESAGLQAKSGGRTGARICGTFSTRRKALKALNNPLSEHYTCQWFAGSELRGGTFPALALICVESSAGSQAV